jgi:large subunit ribosomal protein L40e
MCSILKLLGHGGADKRPSSDPDPPNDEDEHPASDEFKGFMYIYVKVHMNKEIVLEVEPSDTIQLVKAQIQAREGIRWRDQRLHFGHYYRDLQDWRPLHHYNIKDGDLLTLNIRGLGGANKRGGNDAGFHAKGREMARLHSDIDFLQGKGEPEKEGKTREEIRRMDTEYRNPSWTFLDDLPANKLANLEEQIRLLKGKTYQKIAELLTPIMSPTVLPWLSKKKEALERCMETIALQAQLNVVRLLMTDAGYCDFKTFEALLKEKVIYRRGVEFGAAGGALVPLRVEAAAGG